ncbi:MAG: histidine phosphatase family protein [Sulfurimonadaceae bacterium]
MKTLYLIRHAKSDWQDPGASDFERGLTKKGQRDINTMGSYLKLRGILPDLVLASCSLRTQETADGLADRLAFEGPRHYLQELYLSQPETLKETLMLEENHFDSILVVSHNPQVTELANMLTEEHISKIPALGIVAINFDIDEWSELEEAQGEIDFFIYPKQFQYYMPKQIRAVLDLN